MSWLGELLEKNSSDPRARLELGGQILAQLQVNRLPPDSTLLNEFCDLCMQWLGASNYKVALLAVELLDIGVEVSGDVLAPFLLERLSHLIERLGDSKQTVRDAATQLLTDISGLLQTSPHVVLEKVLTGGLSHRQWLVRVGAMNVLRNVLDLYKSDVEGVVNRQLPTICKLLSDPNSEVREVATSTLIHIFCIMGDSCAHSVQKRQLIPENRLAMLMQRYEETLRSGGPSASTSSAGRIARPTTRRFEPCRLNNRQGGTGAFEERENLASGASSRAISVPASKRALGAPSVAVTARNAGSAGAVKDDDFKKAFTQVPKMEVSSARDVVEKLDAIRTTLDNPNADWDRRVNALKMLRGVCLHGGMEHEETLAQELLQLESALLTSVKDLRSQVCREACITVSFLCEIFDVRLVKVVETLLPPLMNLIQNSAKVMSSSATIACQYIVRHVHSPKILPLVLSCMTSKSREIRKQTVELTTLILQTWDPKYLEKSLTLVLDAIKAALNDPDPGARTAARNAFHALEAIFPKQAQYLYGTLDTSKQKALQGQLSQSSSSQSIVSEKDSYVFSHRPGNFGLQKQKAYFAGRSASEIDPGAARRALHLTPQRNVRPPTATPTQASGSYLARKGATPQRAGAMGLPARPGITPLKPSTATNAAGTASNPGSRATSPLRSTSALMSSVRKTSDGPKPAARIGHSTTPARRPPLTAISSRERSPRRFGLGLTPRTNGHAAAAAVPPARRPSDDERFLVSDFARLGVDNEDGGSPAKFHESKVGSAVAAMQSSSIEEKRIGVGEIKELAKSGFRLHADDAKKVMDAFNRLFQESNHKVMPLVVDALPVMAAAWRDQLDAWIYPLLYKLFAKSAVELLPNLQKALAEALAGVRAAFDQHKQLLALCKYITEPAMGLNLKAKCVSLDYLHALAGQMRSAGDLNCSEVRSALLKLFGWMNDPRCQAPTSELATKAERAIADFFELNPAAFSAMLDSFSPEYKEVGLRLVKASASTLPYNNGFSSELSEMSAQISDFVSTRSSPSVARTSNGSSLTPPRNISSLLNSTNESDLRSLTPIEDTSYLARDCLKQNTMIEAAIRDLEGGEKKAVITALNRLTKMVVDGGFTLWEQHFKTLLHQLLSQMRHEDETVQKLALKLLAKICIAQASRFYDLGEMCMMKVLELSVSTVSAVASSADDCAKTLVTHLPSHISIRTIHSLITTPEEPRMPGALKMLTRGVEAMDVDEALKWLPEIAPAVVQAYHHPTSAVRKAAVFCLVALMNKVPEDLKPYLSGLEKSKLALLDVYVQKAQTSSNHF